MHFTQKDVLTKWTRDGVEHNFTYDANGNTLLQDNPSTGDRGNDFSGMQKHDEGKVPSMSKPY